MKTQFRHEFQKSQDVFPQIIHFINNLKCEKIFPGEWFFSK